MKIKINLRLEENLVKRLKELEKKTKIRVAVHVTDALINYLDGKETHNV